MYVHRLLVAYADTLFASTYVSVYVKPERVRLPAVWLGFIPLNSKLDHESVVASIFKSDRWKHTDDYAESGHRYHFD